MADALIVIAILCIAVFVLVRQFRNGCGCDSSNRGASGGND